MGSEWRECSLGDVVRLQRGHDLPDGQRNAGSVPVMGSFGITGWHDEVRAPGPGVTVGRSGASFGVVSYIDRDYWPLNTCLYVTDFLGNDPRFCYYWLSTLGLQRYNSGSAQPSLNRNYIYDMPVRIPDPGQQRRISEILGTLDDKIELNRRMSQTLESMARSLFDASFPVGTIESVPLSDLVESIRDQVSPFDFPDRTFDHYSLPAFDDSQTPVREPGVGIMSAKWRVPEDALLISRLNPQIERVWMADLDSGAESVCSTEFLVLRAVQPYTRAFVYCLVRSEAFQEQIGSVVTGTTGSHQRAQRDAVLNLPAIAPASQRVKWFDSVASPMLSRALQARRQRAELMAIRDAVLPELLSGNLQARSPDRVVGEIA